MVADGREKEGVGRRLLADNESPCGRGRWLQRQSWGRVPSRAATLFCTKSSRQAPTPKSSGKRPSSPPLFRPSLPTSAGVGRPPSSSCPTRRSRRPRKRSPGRHSSPIAACFRSSIVFPPWPISHFHQSRPITAHVRRISVTARDNAFGRSPAPSPIGRALLRRHRAVLASLSCSVYIS